MQVRFLPNKWTQSFKRATMTCKTEEQNPYKRHLLIFERIIRVRQKRCRDTAFFVCRKYRYAEKSKSHKKKIVARFLFTSVKTWCRMRVDFGNTRKSNMYAKRFENCKNGMILAQASKQTYKSVIFACKQTEYDNKLGLLLFGI